MNFHNKLVSALLVVFGWRLVPMTDFRSPQPLFYYQRALI
jgi:hypothetical protein